MKKNKEEWGEPQFLGSPVCEEIAMYVTETDDGTIYFTGNRYRGIYKSVFNNNKFSTPERLPDEINYLHNAGHPYIAPDGSYIIFDGRDERKNSDDTDLYISFRKSDGFWTRAINMGSPINSDAAEICASVSPDGKYLFFQSRRTGNMDIYWVDATIIEKLKPKELNPYSPY
ncbi:MAG: PD40 domain-containing protein [Spirochaetes bacterium]|nr:PD40 domain-containing protein [Spirochaetota bacterium]